MKEDVFTNLIAKKLSGNLSAQEEQLLRNWLSDAPEHRYLQEDMAKVWEWSSHVKMPPADVGSAWKKVEQKLDSGKPRLQIRVNKFFLMAASFLLLCVMAFLLRDTFLSSAPAVLVLETGPSEKLTHTLPDGSVVVLNSNSRLDFAELPGERSLHLSGEGFFEVIRQPTRPFIVHCGNTAVRVLGTSFNIRAYEEEEAIELYVQEGTVSWNRAGEVGAQGTLVTAGMSATFNIEEETIMVTDLSDVNALSWKDERLVFEGMPVSEVLVRLEKHFGIAIEVDNPAILNCRFFGKFESVSAEEVLQSLSFSMDLQYNSIGADVYRLSGSGCPDQQ